jgi:threonine dehydrogenase-like Zn-dependent dehydrogenase
MSVHFYTERGFPRELRQLGGYAAYGEGEAQAVSDTVGHLTGGVTDITGQLTGGAVGIAKAVSPWEFLTGIFVDKPKAEAAAQLAQSELAARAVASQQAARQQTMRTVLLVGAGLVGVLVIVVATKPRKSQVAGYHKKRRARR